jgi:hypothetical protein
MLYFPAPFWLIYFAHFKVLFVGGGGGGGGVCGCDTYVPIAPGRYYPSTKNHLRERFLANLYRFEHNNMFSSSAINFFSKLSLVFWHKI